MINKPQTELGGILVALATPFTDDGSQIDTDRLNQHIDRMINAGIHGLVPGGSTGEFTVMTMAERQQLLELVVKHTAGRIPVVAGIGTLSSADNITLAAHAAATGATALMVVPPFYEAPDYDTVKILLKEISAAADGLPIMYYNIPSATGVKLSPAQLAGLRDCGVSYLKDTSGDGPALTELLFGLDDQITAFNGWDTLTFYGLAAGAKGSVWGASNIIPELSVQLWETLAVQKDLQKARELWRVIFPVCKFLESYHYPSAVKTGMELLGWKTGGMRRPWRLLEGEARGEFAGLLKAAGCQVVE